MLRTLEKRACQSPPHDLALTISWSHLNDLLHKLSSLQEATSLEQPLHPQPEAGYSAPFFQCNLCDFCTADVSAFRRHCTRQHGLAMHRTRYNLINESMVNGLPTCKHCLKEFTTWRSFYIHIERGCQAILAGPALCTDWHPQGPALGSLCMTQPQPEMAAVRGLRLISAEELWNLKQQAFGSRLLQIVQDRAWELIAACHEACQYLSKRCIICSFQFSRCQELHQHYRQQHADLWEFAP